MSGDRQKIFGATIFDKTQAQKGFALNKMCFAFNQAENREKFRADPESVMAAHGLSEPQKQAVRGLDVLGLIAQGGNVYYLAKLAGMFGLDVQDLGAAQTGLSKEAFKARLVAQNAQSAKL